MMRNGILDQLQELIRKLASERQQHLDAVARIEQAFDDLGIAPPAGKRRGRPRKAGGALRRRPGRRVNRGRPGRPGRPGRRTRKRYAVSGTQSILDFVKKAGTKGASGADIASLWKRQGRRGSSYNILNAMLKKGLIKRKKTKGERGSTYHAA